MLKDTRHGLTMFVQQHAVTPCACLYSTVRNKQNEGSQWKSDTPIKAACSISSTAADNHKIVIIKSTMQQSIKIM